MIPSPSQKFRTLLPIAFLALLFAAPRAHAQAPIEPAQLPARTAFYIVWRGEPAGDIRKANNLFALWDDPEFAPVRAAMFDNIDHRGPRRQQIPQPSPASLPPKLRNIPRSSKTVSSSAISANPIRK